MIKLRERGWLLLMSDQDSLGFEGRISRIRQTLKEKPRRNGENANSQVDLWIQKAMLGQVLKEEESHQLCKILMITK